ncbi:unnamed protein product [Moneuplotes crassus]|uniref:Peptidase C1A papain C-terminal domain-containing protein n=1 Tax=Euplotes crassus TaxID=5936 RepID=A0AAD1XLV5_EUPCR|nr:unnamed protein product [Moneuplotes crassus]
MKLLICAVLLVSVALASHPINKEIVEEIKQATKLWTPTDPEENIFRFHHTETLVSMLGTKIDHERDMEVGEDMGINDYLEEGENSVPSSFDSREAWGDICPFNIKDQGACGSCWAFGAIEAFEDRICIQSEGKFTTDLSEQHLVSCDYVGMGCSGGWPLSAFGYLSLMGVPSEECQPYYSGQTGSAWGCKSKCQDTNDSNKRYRCKYPWMNFTNKGIKAEIMKNGPVETTMMVYEDFMSYKEGIYHHVAGKLLGGHAIKLVGWGVEEGVKYWIMANSWSENWGENGYFRIVEGNSSAGNSGFSCTPYAY